MCAAKPKDSEWALLDVDGQPVGEACLRCWRPFQAEYQRDGTWEEVCDKCEEEVYNNGYEKAAKNMAKEQPNGHDPSEVFAEDDYELETVRSFVAIPRGSYSTAADGANPSDHGFTESDCPDELGNGFKGLVIVNPLRPFVEYNLIHKMGVCKRDMKLPLR